MQLEMLVIWFALNHLWIEGENNLKKTWVDGKNSFLSGNNLINREYVNDDMLGCASSADLGEPVLLHGSQVDLKRVWEVAGWGDAGFTWCWPWVATDHRGVSITFSGYPPCLPKLCSVSSNGHHRELLREEITHCLLGPCFEPLFGPE